MDQIGIEVLDEFRNVIECLEFSPIDGDDEGWTCTIHYEDGHDVILSSSAFDELLWDIRNYLVYGGIDD